MTEPTKPPAKTKRPRWRRKKDAPGWKYKKFELVPCPGCQVIIPKGYEDQHECFQPFIFDVRKL